ncbi:TPA: hypothetical protein ACGWER_002012 [Streptococcus agalactiae]|nr:hypothetical protein [Streptococcus agalactiae]HEO2267356.1 hypothetical protein [Streptococcus agalactiae]HEO7770503.1 hypothetical protein [Streptococcus agalactiae]
MNAIEQLIEQLKMKVPSVGSLAQSQYELLKQTNATEQQMHDFVNDLKIALR